MAKAVPDGDLTVKITADTREFDISICGARLDLAKAEVEFWEKQLEDALAKRG